MGTNKVKAYYDEAYPPVPSKTTCHRQKGIFILFIPQGLPDGIAGFPISLMGNATGIDDKNIRLFYVSALR